LGCLPASLPLRLQDKPPQVYRAHSYEARLGRAPPSKDRVATESILMGKWVQEHRRRPGSSFGPTPKVSSRTEWSQCPIGQECGKLATRSCYRLTSKARASQRNSQRSGQVPTPLLRYTALEEKTAGSSSQSMLSGSSSSTLQPGLHSTPVGIMDATKPRRFSRNVLMTLADKVKWVLE